MRGRDSAGVAERPRIDLFEWGSRIRNQPGAVFGRNCGFCDFDPPHHGGSKAMQNRPGLARFASSISLTRIYTVCKQPLTCSMRGKWITAHTPTREEWVPRPAPGDPKSVSYPK